MKNIFVILLSPNKKQVNLKSFEQRTFNFRRNLVSKLTFTSFQERGVEKYLE